MGPFGRPCWSCSVTGSNHIALTGIAKAGYLLKQTSTTLDEWHRCFFLLNGHSITYCSRSSDFAHPDGDILLTSATKVHQTGDALLRIETGYEILMLRGRNTADNAEWRRAIEVNVAQIGDLARGYFHKVKRFSQSRKCFFFMLHK